MAIQAHVISFEYVSKWQNFMVWKLFMGYEVAYTSEKG
jgi:hypothetical protein